MRDFDDRLTTQSDTFSGGTGNVVWTFAAKTAASATYTVNGLNQYATVNGAAYAYDANGNLTDDGPTTFTYDIENRLVKAVAGSTTTNLVYDPLGRLFEVNQGSSATTTRFLNDGDAMVSEHNSGNAIVNRFVHGSNAAADDPLVWYLGSTMTIKRWLHADHLGSVVAVTNSSGGSPSINRYDEYGVPSSTNIGRFQYTGQAWIGEVGLYYYKARFYSPGLGRFMQVDPVGYEGGINLYAYVGNDPITAGDPSGFYECDPNKPNDCKAVEAARKEIVAARENLRDQTGSRIPSAGYQDLTRMLRTLGTQNDDNGLTVQFGKLENAYAKTAEDTITLDRSKIESNDRLSIASVLTHELSHQFDQAHGLDAGPRINEIKANAIQSIFEIGTGKAGEFYRPGISAVELIRRLKESGLQRPYCPGGGVIRAGCADDINRMRPDVPIKP